MSGLLVNSVIKAGAGAGKTEELTQSVYKVFKNFISSKKREPKLIVCTFTRKASKELKERLFKIALSEIKNFSSENREVNSVSFLNYLQSSFLQVSTIDGILNRFLKKQGSFINLNPDFEISYSSINKELFDTLAEKFIYDKYFSLLEKFQYFDLRDIFLSYFNNRLKYKNISFYDDLDFEDFKKDKDMVLAFIENKNLPTDFFKKHPYLNFLDIQALKDLTKSDEKFNPKEFIPVFKDLKKAGEELFPLFLEKKKNSSILNIEDLLLFSHHLIKENPSVVKAFSKQWDYWFIDEYQDTSWLQEQVIQKLTNFKKVFCVGDPGQSIYSFRGADPQVFHRRESMVKSAVKTLEVNRRSSSQLIGFYNDFFEKEPFINFKTSSQTKLSSLDPCLSFFTYNKQEEDYKKNTFKSLYYYIESLRSKGVDYGDIAILSSRNEDMAQITDYLRDKNLPVIFESSRKFSKNRLVLDSLFLLKFLINPSDDVNLKALLRTPYFRLIDQDLANRSYEYDSYKKNLLDKSYESDTTTAYLSFWSFIKDKHKKSLFVKQLTNYLDNEKQFGLFESFKQALFDSALLDLSYWQDPTSFSEANLWKLLNLLYNKKFSELKLFYELLEKEQEQEGEHLKSARPCEKNSFISLMTIHKSKGLEFEHVILADFSMDDTPLRTGRKIEQIAVFDRKRNKMTVAVPIGGREKKKIKAYGHEIYNRRQDQIKISEQERLYYVAMTRAKDSLAVFIPHGKEPKKNSWLKGVSYFDKIQNLSYKDRENKTWQLNSGFYKTENYILTVHDCNTFNKKSQLIISSSDKIKNQVKTIFSGNTDKDINFIQSKDFIQAMSINLQDKTDKKTTQIKSYSSKNFIQFINQKEIEKQTKSSFKKAKNILFKSSLGSQLHFFLQKLFYFPFEKLESLITSSPFLCKENQEKIKKALIYVQNLKEPNMSDCFKNGFSEWSFKFQEKAIILKGQIDLWSWSGKEIYLFDYKSSFSKNVKNQLIFYSWILNQMYQPKAIWMYECYPLQENIKKTLYQPEHKELFDSWFSSL